LHQTRTSLAADSIGISPGGLLVWLIHLMKMQTYSGKAFPDPSWCVPGIIPEGCCILSGHPKIGKSFLVLAIDERQSAWINPRQRPDPVVSPQLLGQIDSPIQSD
jgi:hypothetical protein